MGERVFNFAAGPAVLPLPVLEEAARELVNHKGDGMSVMEMSHRTKMFEDIHFGAQDNLRKLMNIPDNYKILFLQGGATLQFSMVPLNLYRKSKTADFIDTGAWTQKAIAEAKKIGNVRVVASSKEDKFTHIPAYDEKDFDPNADFLYIVTNNTIYGTKHPYIPTAPEGVPLVADASSNVLSEKVNMEDYGLYYFGTQKNAGPAGLTVVIVRDDLIGHCPSDAPVYLDYKTHADSDSMYNTPPCNSIYMTGLILQWMLDNGGVDAMQKRNEEKAALLYDFIDNSTLYQGTVTQKEHRSLMNVTYVLNQPDLTEAFVKAAAAEGLVNLKGHRSVGGIRASIYNAMPLEGVKALIDFMGKFEKENK